MPELPEIETIRSRLHRTLKGKRIASVVVDEEDFVCYDQAEPLEVAKALRGATVTGTGRKGKYFWLELDRKPWLVLHMGMTGNVQIRRARKGKLDTQWGWGGLQLWSTPKTRAEIEVGKPPRFCRLFLVLENGVEVAVTDPRRFGRVRLSEAPHATPAIGRLGYDPLQEFPTAKKLREILSRRRVAIKAVLLDQSVFAGVGNWIADEILYQAGINPHRLACELSLVEVTKLRHKLLSIIETSVGFEADYDLYPKRWLFHHRWGKGKNAQDYRGRPLLFETIGGRTTAWVPDVQN